MRPLFAHGRAWYKRASGCKRLDRRVNYDPDDGYEYEPDPNPHKRTWHQINPRTCEYREIDPDPGQPVAGSEDAWRRLQ